MMFPGGFISDRVQDTVQAETLEKYKAVTSATQDLRSASRRTYKDIQLETVVYVHCTENTVDVLGS